MMRWLLLEEVLVIQKGIKARTRSRIPEAPVSAEPLLIEMMAQTGGLLLGAETDYGQDVVFTKIEKAEFLDGLIPGEAIDIEVTSEALRPEGGWLDGVIRNSKSEVVATSRFLLMNVGHLIEGRAESLTFHAGFMNHFNVHQKVVADLRDQVPLEVAGPGPARHPGGSQ